MKIYPLFLTITCALFITWACEKDNATIAAESTILSIHLTDGPGDAQQVNVDIQEVLLKLANDSSHWMSLATNVGVYNLLDFQNGIDTIIATGPVPLDTLKEIRLVLGSDNTIMIDSVLYDLETPSAQQSGLKIKIDKNLGLLADSVVIDFDAEKSILETGNGKYILKPVIKVK